MYRPHLGKSIIALVLVGLALMSGCGNGKSTKQIAQGFDDAFRSTQVKAGQQDADEAGARAKSAACSALDAYSSDPAQSLTDRLKAEAAVQRIRQALGLTEVDPALPQRLVDAADEIDGTQKAGEVFSELGC